MHKASSNRFEYKLTDQMVRKAFQRIAKRLTGFTVDEYDNGRIAVFRSPAGRITHIVCPDDKGWVCACCEPGQCAATLYLIVRAMTDKAA